jgi:hypothetical protein
MSAPTAAAARRRTLFRSATAPGFIGLAFDANDRKDQNGSATFAWSAIHGQPPRSCICREFDDGAHVKLAASCRCGVIWPATEH